LPDASGHQGAEHQSLGVTGLGPPPPWPHCARRPCPHMGPTHTCPHSCDMPPCVRVQKTLVRGALVTHCPCMLWLALLAGGPRQCPTRHMSLFILAPGLQDVIRERERWEGASAGRGANGVRAVTPRPHGPQVRARCTLASNAPERRSGSWGRASWRSTGVSCQMRACAPVCLRPTRAFRRAPQPHLLP